MTGQHIKFQGFGIMTKKVIENLARLIDFNWL